MSSSTQYRIGVVGLGLIGGSLALALRRAGVTAHICGWDVDEAVPLRGRELGVIDDPADSLEGLVRQVDVAVLATPARASESLLPRMLAHAGDDTIITDVASVKGPLCDLVQTLPDEQAARFVPGHPIAGSERHGVDAARAGLFATHRVILAPLEVTDPRATAVVRELWEATGASVVEMPVPEHDEILAATSHLPHILAYGLVEALTSSSARTEILRFAAGGFRDFTRIASSDPVMWRDISLANRDALLAEIDNFSVHLAGLRSAIEAGDGNALESRFADAKAARDEFVRLLEERSSGNETASGATARE